MEIKKSEGLKKRVLKHEGFWSRVTLFLYMCDGYLNNCDGCPVCHKQASTVTFPSNDKHCCGH
jgi:hypothetical protein